jgi:hypothetical protein
MLKLSRTSTVLVALSFVYLKTEDKVSGKRHRIVISVANQQRVDADPDRGPTLKISVLDLHWFLWFLCGSGSSIFGQCGSGSRVLITRTSKENIDCFKT